MPKNTRKNYKYKNVENLERTFISLENWRTHVFESLGWMVLAKEKGYVDKLVEYKNSIQRLKNAIELKISKIKSLDKKRDLEIMHSTICCLEEHCKNYL